MGVPDWRKSSAGARVRVALWLHSEIGAGGTFTKADLRRAFPGVEQIDRRMRDLRSEGWVITTYQEDRSLATDELRLVKEGGAVWEPGYQSQQPRAITAKERMATMAADNFVCVVCGISGGEPFPDAPLHTAKLSVARQGAGESKLATLCDRCIAGGPSSDLVGLLAEIDALLPNQRDQLAEWVRRRFRPRNQQEALWARYRRLPSAERAAVERHLGP